MAKRRPGGQPGNKNAKGHKGANGFSPGARRASERQSLRRKASNASRVKYPLGTKIRGTVRGQMQYIKRNRKAFAKSAVKTAVQGAAIATITIGSVGAFPRSGRR